VTARRRSTVVVAAAAAGTALVAGGAVVALARGSSAEATAPELRERHVSVDGVDRTFWLQPARTPNAPLVIGLHGLHGTARPFAQATGLAAAAAAADVALVVPESVGPAWNDGRLGPQGPDDQRFLLDVVDALVAEDVVDPDRVVVTGFSNGAEMTLVMAAEHPDVLAGAVAVSGELLAGDEGARPSGVVPVWFTHGDADAVQPWRGRPSSGPLLPALVSQDETAEAFRVANGAAAEPSRRTLATGPDLTGPVVETAWASTGPGSAPVTLFRLPGAGHHWPLVQETGFDATGLVLDVATTVRRQPG
jgi:polyhydroxybutyrate depolymerase